MVSSLSLAAVAALVLSAPQGKLSLEEAYARAAASSEAVRASAATVRRAEILQGTPWTTVAPTLIATAESVTQTEVEVDGVLITPADQLRGRVDLEQPLVRSGFFAGRRAAALSAEAARGDDARVRQQLMMDTVDAFIGVLRSRQQVQVALGALARAEAQEKSAENRAKAGAALRTTVLLSTIDRRRAQLDVIAAQAALRTIEATFERVIRQPAPESLVLPIPPPLGPLGPALERAAKRQDIRAFEARAESARQSARALRARMLRPELSLRGSVEAFDPPSRNREDVEYRAIAVLEIPLSRGGADFQDARVARTDATIAEENAKALRETVADEVRQAFVRLEQSQQAAKLLLDQVRDARENYGLVESQFRLGGATPLEVANAQAALTEAETLEAVASYDQQLATYLLLFATGQLDLAQPRREL